MVKRKIEKIIIHPAFTTTRKDQNIGISIERMISCITFEIVSNFFDNSSQLITVNRITCFTFPQFIKSLKDRKYDDYDFLCDSS